MEKKSPLSTEESICSMMKFVVNDLVGLHKSYKMSNKF